MRSLTFAIRGIWWRRWASLAVWFVAVVCIAVAAIGPSYAASARDAVLQTTLRQAPTDARGTGISVSFAVDGRVNRDAIASRIDDAFAALVDAGYLREPVLTEGGEKGVLRGGSIVATLPLVYRDAACNHVIVQAGRCVSESDRSGMIITAETAAARHWKVGTSVVLSTGGHTASARVRGIYEPRDVTGRYWFARSNDYFHQVAAFAASAVPRGDAVLVPAAFWDRVLPPATGDNVFVGSDFALDSDNIHASNLARGEKLITDATDRIYHPQPGDSGVPTVATRLVTLLDKAGDRTQAVGLPILIVGLQLLVLTWLVLYLVLVSSADSRTAEIVLGKLRGLSPRETALHTLLEPLLLIGLAVPAGIYAGGAFMRTVGNRLLGGHVEVVVPPLSLLAAAGAAAGGVVATLVAGSAVLRRSVVDQWRRTERRPSRRSWVFEAVVVVLAVVGFVELATAPTMRRHAAFLPSLLPGLLALAAAVVAARLVPWLARSGFGWTRASRRIGLFIALRQIGRRPGDLRVFVLLAVAVALFVFGFASRAVFDDNQRQRALTEVGTIRVVSVSSPTGLDPRTVAARLDPQARWASAVYDGPVGVQSPPVPFTGETTNAPSLLIVDPERFARVAFWRADFGPHADLSDQLAPLRARPPKQASIVGTSLQVAFTAQVRADLPLTLRLGLTDSRGARVVASLGRLGSGTQQRTARVAVPQCRSGCLVRRVSIIDGPGSATVPRATITVASLRVIGTASTSDALPSLAAARWAAQDTNEGDAPAETVSADGDGLTFAFAPIGFSASTEGGYSVVANVAGGVPALVTRTLTSRTSRVLTVNPDRADDLILRTTAVSVLPRAGNAGVVIPRAWLPAARPDGFLRYRPNQIWLGAGAPSDAPERIARAGLTVRGVQSAGERAAALGAQGPSYAATMLLVGAAAAGGLALIGATASLLIASRRRLYELAAMRSMGVPARRVLGSLVLEQTVVNVVAAAVGVFAGLFGARAALARVPQFTDDPEYPRVLLDPPILINIVLVVAVIVVVTAAGALGGAALVRQADPTRLREAQQ